MIGKLLAKELGIKYYGREIFEMSQGVESDLDSGDDESIHNASLEEADELFKHVQYVHNQAFLAHS